MKKQICSISLVLALSMSLPTPYTYVMAGEMKDTIQTYNTQTRGTTYTVGHNEDLRAAVEKAQNGDTIIINGIGQVNARDGEGDAPWVINKDITIIGGKNVGDNNPSIALRPGGIILGANVTFRDIELSFANNVRSVIMVNGYKLTLNNVTKARGGRNIHLACGGLTGSTLTVNSGKHSEIILSGNTSLSNIYAGSIAYADWTHQVGVKNEFTGDATITVVNDMKGKMGNVYASGAQETPVDPKHMLNPDYVVDPPKADASKFKTTGNVNINLYSSAITNINGETGGTKNASVSFDTEYPINNIELSNIEALSVNSGNFTPIITSGLLNTAVTVKKDAILNFQKTTNPSINSLQGEGSIILGQDQTLNIRGNVADTRNIAIGDIRNNHSTTLPKKGHIYIYYSKELQ